MEVGARTEEGIERLLHTALLIFEQRAGLLKLTCRGFFTPLWDDPLRLLEHFSLLPILLSSPHHHLSLLRSCDFYTDYMHQQKAVAQSFALRSL